MAGGMGILGGYGLRYRVTNTRLQDIEEFTHRLANQSLQMDADGNVDISGVLTIGTAGELRQGTGTLGVDFTGLRIWHDTSIGRIAGYNTDVLQWYGDTDGKFYAGAGAVMLSATGITIKSFNTAITNPSDPAGVAGTIKWVATDGTTAIANIYASYRDGTPDTGAQVTIAPELWDTSTATAINLTATNVFANGNLYPGNQSARYFSDDGTYTTVSAGLSITSGLNVGTATGASAAGIIAQSSYLEQSVIAAPSAPAANLVRIFAIGVQGHSRPAYIDDDGIVYTIGRDNFIIVRNTSGSAMTKGQAVHVTGSTGNVPNVALARADSLTTLPAVGLLMADIANNAFGPAIILGILSDIDTSSLSSGDRLYVSAVTAGALVNTRPAYPNFAQRMGSVLVSGVGNGSIDATIAPFIGGEESGTSAASFTVAGGLNVGTATAATTAGEIAYSDDLEPLRGGVSYTGYVFVPLVTPLTSTSWDGDSYSTTASTSLDLSAVFGAPAGIKAVALMSVIRDSASATSSIYFTAGANDGVTWAYEHYASGLPNDTLSGNSGVVPCDANGDIYYSISASGAGTMDIWLRIVGYWI